MPDISHSVSKKDEQTIPFFPAIPSKQTPFVLKEFLDKKSISKLNEQSISNFSDFLNQGFDSGTILLISRPILSLKNFNKLFSQKHYKKTKQRLNTILDLMVKNKERYRYAILKYFLEGLDTHDFLQYKERFRFISNSHKENVLSIFSQYVKMVPNMLPNDKVHRFSSKKVFYFLFNSINKQQIREYNEKYLSDLLNSIYEPRYQYKLEKIHVPDNIFNYIMSISEQEFKKARNYKEYQTLEKFSLDALTHISNQKITSINQIKGLDLFSLNLRALFPELPSHFLHKTKSLSIESKEIFLRISTYKMTLFKDPSFRNSFLNCLKQIQDLDPFPPVFIRADKHFYIEANGPLVSFSFLMTHVLLNLKKEKQKDYVTAFSYLLKKMDSQPKKFFVLKLMGETDFKINSKDKLKLKIIAKTIDLVFSKLELEKTMNRFSSLKSTNRSKQYELLKKLDNSLIYLGMKLVKIFNEFYNNPLFYKRNYTLMKKKLNSLFNFKLNTKGLTNEQLLNVQIKKINFLIKNLKFPKNLK